MNKYIAYTTYFLLSAWSVLALQFFSDNPIVLTTMLMLLLEIIGVIVIVLNFRNTMNSTLNGIVLIWCNIRDTEYPGEL